MLRLVLLFLCLLAGCLALWRLYHAFRRKQFDWPGVAFAVGFVLLAIWLRNLTGIGGSFG